MSDKPDGKPADQQAGPPKDSPAGSPGRPDVTGGDGGSPGAGRGQSPQTQGSTGGKRPETGKPAEASSFGSAGKENSVGKTGRADVTAAGENGPEGEKANYRIDVIRGEGPEENAAVIWRNEQEGGDIILEFENNAYLDQYLNGEVTAKELVRDGHAIWTGVDAAKGVLPHPTQDGVPGASNKDMDAAGKEPAPAGKERQPAGPGSEKTTLRDGASVERQGGTTRLEHPDGGKQERGPDGTNRYEGRGVTVTAGSGKPIVIEGDASVRTNPDGDVIATTKNGTTITASPQGDLWVDSTDGSSRGIGRDGTVSISDGKGWSMTISPDGSRSTTYHAGADGTIVGKESDGSVSIGYPDGSQTRLDPDGTQVDTKPDGSVKVDKPYGLIGVRTPERNLESGGWGAFLFPGINSGAWEREPIARSDQDPVHVRSPELARGPVTIIYTYQNGDKVQLTREDMEDALRFGLPPGTELTDFENQLLDGTAKGGHEFRIRLDVERGTVGYTFGYQSGGGTEVYNRQGELISPGSEVGLEDPGITPLDFVGAGAGIAKGMIEGAAKGIAKHFMKEETKEGIADLGSHLAKEGVKDEAADLGGRAAGEVGELAGEAGKQATPSGPKQSIWKGVEDQGEAVIQTRGGLVGKTEQHHLFPQKFNEFFEKAGINIDDYVVVVDREIHKVTHGKGGFFNDFNKEWADWIDKNPQATEQQIFEQAGRMMDKYGLSLGHKLQDYTKK